MKNEIKNIIKHSLKLELITATFDDFALFKRPLILGVYGL